MLGAIALMEVAGVPADERRDLWLGRTAVTCPWIIAALAIPIFVAVLLALRKLAPTRQRLAGFSAGCLAGAAAAGLYAIHCNETAAAFGCDVVHGGYSLARSSGSSHRLACSALVELTLGLALFDQGPACGDYLEREFHADPQIERRFDITSFVSWTVGVAFRRFLEPMSEFDPETCVESHGPGNDEGHLGRNWRSDSPNHAAV